MNWKIVSDTIEAAPVKKTERLWNTKQFRTSGPIDRRRPIDGDCSIGSMADPKVAKFFTQMDGAKVSQSIKD